MLRATTSSLKNLYSLMADQILSWSVEKLVDIIANTVWRQFSYLLHYNANLVNYKNQLEGLETAGRGVKQRVKAAERNGEVILANVEEWLKRIDAASKESKVFVEEEHAISKCCFIGPLNLKVRYQRSKKAKEKAKEFADTKKDGRFDSVSVPAPPLPIGSMINENEFDFESRRSIFNEIMEAIKDDGVRMIGIWGMPGIGKTTLVERAAKYARDEGLFEEVAMAVVSHKLSFKSIQGQIADKIGLKLTSQSKEGRADQLHRTLLTRKKPILIILDDIWKRIELNDIGIPSRSQHKGCKIILTSRNRSVFEEMGTQKNFTINLLSANEALDLFLKMSGIDDRCSEKKQLAEKLSEECGRLPISIVIVARGLLNKGKVSWEDMLNRLRKSNPDRKVHANIELSYDNLYLKEEKMFFLLCAVFPKDYKIPVQVLFEYGLGLNLFEKVDNIDEAVVRAQNLVLRLKSQCLLLDEGDENFVKMHYVIRDVALAITSEGKHGFLVPRTSLWFDDVKKLPDILECSQLQILMLHFSHQDFQLHDNFFATMKNLIVLDMSFMQFVRLPQSFAALENLRTLRFSNCHLGDISAIWKLQNLVCLSFYGSDIIALPKEIGELSNLRLLDLSNCSMLEILTPRVIQNLSQLEMLRMGSNVRWCDGKEVCHSENASLSELIHLSSRLMILEIWIPYASMLPDDVLFENLTRFNVSIGKGGFARMNIFSSNLQILQLISLSKTELLKVGIKMLMKKAQHMKLKGISGISVALSSHLGGHGSLKELVVNHCLDVNYILDVNKSKYETPLQQLHLIELPSLIHLEVKKCKNLQAIWHTHSPIESFFQLKVLKLTQCPRLLIVFPPQATSSLLNLEEICIENCDKLETLFQLDDVALTVGDEMVLFPQLLTLKLINLPKFKAILSTTSQTTSQTTVIFSDMENMTLCRLHDLESIMDQQLLTFFPKLKKLELECIGRLSSTTNPFHIMKGLEALEDLRIEDNNGKTLPQVIATLPKLRTLQLGFIQEPIEWSETLYRCGGFQSLTSLNFFSCNGVKSLLRAPTFSCLVNLQKLFVSKCETMESIVGETSGQPNVDKVIEFSKLYNLQLDNLPRLTSFYNGECALKFPSIGHFSIKKCPKLKTFASMSRETPKRSWQNFVSNKALFGQQVSFGRLSHLVLERLESMEEIWHHGHLATTVGELINLRVKDCHRLLNLFSSNMLVGLQNLVRLHVRSCRSLEHVFAVEDHPPLLSNLQKLELYDLPQLKQLWWNKNTRESFGLPSLHSLRIDTCPTLQFIFDPSVANCLENLRTLFVENCSSIVKIVEKKPGKKIEFPLLDNLYLVNLPCFKVNLSVEFPQVEFVYVDHCLNTKERNNENRILELRRPVGYFERFVEFDPKQEQRKLNRLDLYSRRR